MIFFVLHAIIYVSHMTLQVKFYDTSVRSPDPRRAWYLLISTSSFIILVQLNPHQTQHVIHPTAFSDNSLFMVK